MAAVVPTTQSLFARGGLWVWELTGVTVTSDGDTFNTGFSEIVEINPVADGNNGVGATISGSSIAFQTGAGEVLTRLTVKGKF